MSTSNFSKTPKRDFGFLPSGNSPVAFLFGLFGEFALLRLGGFRLRTCVVGDNV